MSTDYKRMQQRYGDYDDFDDDKGNLLPHEFASVNADDPNTSDGKALYFNFGVGSIDCKRVLMDGIDTSDITDGSVTLDKLASDVEVELNSKVTAVFATADSDVFDDNTLLQRIYYTTVNGIAYRFYTVRNGNGVQVQFRESVNGIEKRDYDVSTQTWGSFENIGGIPDGAVTYNKLSLALQEKVDSITDFPLSYNNAGTLIAADALNNGTYCNAGVVHQFNVQPPLSQNLGLSQGDLCELRYVNGYQILTVTETQEKLVRKINSVAPVFSADSWVKVIDNIENGEILSTAIYPSGSTKTITGTYSLNGDYCTVTAIAGTVFGETLMTYPLPVSASSVTVVLGVETNMCSVTATDSRLYIRPLDSNNSFRGSNASFTISYKYK